MWKFLLSIFGFILLLAGVLFLYSYLVEENRQADYEKALAVLGNATSGKLKVGDRETSLSKDQILKFKDVFENSVETTRNRPYKIVGRISIGSAEKELTILLSERQTFHFSVSEKGNDYSPFHYRKTDRNLMKYSVGLLIGRNSRNPKHGEEQESIDPAD
jgi:hypothetical protein